MRTARTTRSAALAVVTLAALTACHGRTGPTGSSTPSTPGTSSSPTPTVGDLPPSTSGTAGRTSAAAPTASDATSTRQLVVRPVTAAGDLAAGWTARTGSGSIDCSAGTRSPVAQGDGVLDCAPSAASAVACWRARDHTHAYCLLDPRGRTLVEYTLAGGAFGTPGPAELEPRPIALDLVGGARCTVRDSGAAGALTTHPDWVPYYYCGADADQAAWGDPDSAGGGITRGDGRWTVALAPSDGSAATKDTEVVTAYLVATA